MPVAEAVAINPVTGAVTYDTETVIASNVAGDTAAGASDSGNPVKVGGKYNSTKPTLTNGQRGDLQLGSRGAASVQLYLHDSATALADTTVTDGQSPAAAVNGKAIPLLFNGTTWDLQRGNVDTAALINASGATTSQTGTDQTNYNARGVKVVLDMTNAGTGSVTITIQGKDAASGKYYTLLAGAAVTSNSTNTYTVYPGITAAANVSASDVLPRVWRVITTANNANATTYTVGASVIV